MLHLTWQLTFDSNFLIEHCKILFLRILIPQDQYNVSLHVIILQKNSNMRPHFCLWTVLVWFYSEFVVLDLYLKKKKKKEFEQPPESQGAGSGILSTHSHATHVAAGPQEAEGSSPAGQVSKSSQGLTTTSWLHLPCSLLRQVSMASTWSTFSELRLAQNAPAHPCLIYIFFFFYIFAL